MSLKEDLGRALGALSYANAGELLSFEEKCRILGVDPPEDFPRYPDYGAEARREVAVNVGADLPEPLVNFALDTCRTMEAGLVLTSTQGAGTVRRLMKPFQARFDEAGIRVRIAAALGTGVEAVIRYVRDHGDVLFLVFSAEDVEAEALPRKRSATGAWPSPVPTVIFSAPRVRVPEPAR